MKRPDLFGAAPATNRDDAPAPADAIIRVRQAGWQAQKAMMLATWLERLRAAADVERIAFIQERIDYLKGVRE